MRRIKTEQIRGREILAKDIYSAGGVVLISEGTILKKEYVEKLLELKVTDVFVEDEISKEIKKHPLGPFVHVLKKDYSQLLCAYYNLFF